MAVLAVFTGAITEVQYGTLKFTVYRGYDRSNGPLLHAAYLNEDGRIQVAEIWDSREALDGFVALRLSPMLDALKIRPLELTVYPMHFFAASDAIAGHRL